MIPIFHSNKSLRSILNLEPSGKQKDYQAPSIFDAAKDLGLSKLVVVDDYPTAFMELFKQCPKEDLQLIYGLRITVCNNIEDRTPESLRSHAKYNVLCKNGSGWRALSKIYSLAATTGFYRINKLEAYQRIDWKHLKELWSDDLILMPCFYDGFIYQNLFEFSEHVPDFSFTNPVFELQYHEHLYDDPTRERVLEYAKKKNFETLEAHSVYYRKYSEAKAFMVYKANKVSRPGKRASFAAPELPRFNCNDFCAEHLVGEVDESTDPFLSQFEDYSKTLSFPGVILPEIKGGYKDSHTYLRELCRQAWAERGIGEYPNKDDYADRIKYELGVLEKFGFSTYILMVYEMLEWCKKNGVAVGPGRGSVAGAITAWLLGITKCDPIKYGLIFERFLNEGRVKQKEVDGVVYTDGSALMDIDSDISFLDRDRLIREYIDVEYAGKTSKILTVNTFTSKLCIKEVGKSVGEYSEDEMNRITSKVDVLFGKPTPLTDFKENKDDVNPEVKGWLHDNPDVFEVALKLENLGKNFGAHASGYIISNEILSETMPYQLSEDGQIISAYEMDDALSLAQKLDLLGLRTLDVIHETAKDVGVSLEDIDWEDPFIYDQLQNLTASYGVFQSEDGMGFKTISTVKPKSFRDLGACLALSRPGAFNSIDRYARFVESGEVEPFDPYLDEYLKDTGGVLLYQETLIKILNKMCGLTLKEADEGRKIIGKKKKELLDEYEQKVRPKAEQKGVPKESFDKFWHIVNASASYLFNASHSFSYGVITAYTVYLKFKYPLEFLTNCLNMSRHEQKPHVEAAKIIRELPLFGLKIYPPSIESDNFDFHIHKGGIRIGVAGLRGIADKALEHLKNFDIQIKNKFHLFETFRNAGLTITVFESLAKAGCFHELSDNRGRLCLEARAWNLLTPREIKLISPHGESYNYDILGILGDIKEGKLLDNGRPIMKLEGTEKRRSRWDTFSSCFDEYRAAYKEYKENKDLSDYLAEKNICGFAFSKTLHEIFSVKMPEIVRVETIKSDGPGEYYFVGQLIEIQERTSRNGNKYRKLVFEADTDEIEIYFFYEGKKSVNIEKNCIYYVKATRSDGDLTFLSAISKVR